MGVILCIVGEGFRKLAMLTAGRNFTHLIQFQKRAHHELITHGIYSLFRHPSYVGWFWWSVGTQVSNILKFISFHIIFCRWLCAIRCVQRFTPILAGNFSNREFTTKKLRWSISSASNTSSTKIGYRLDSRASLDIGRIQIKVVACQSWWRRFLGG